MKFLPGSIKTIGDFYLDVGVGEGEKERKGKTKRENMYFPSAKLSYIRTGYQKTMLSSSSGKRSLSLYTF